MDKAKILSTNIVVLFEGGKAGEFKPRELMRLLGSEVTVEVAVTTLGPGAVINVLGEQHEISIVPGRLQVTDRSGRPSRSSKTAQFLYRFLPLLGELSIKALGFNYEAVIDFEGQEPAAKRVALRFLKPESSVRMKLGDVEGAAIRLRYAEGDKKHTLVVEPRFQDWTAPRLFVSLNVHHESSSLPRQEELERVFGESYARMQRIMRRLLR